MRCLNASDIIPRAVAGGTRYGSWACLFVFLSIPVIAAPATILQGTVIDSEGAAISSAHIIVHDDGSGQMSRDRAADVTLSPDEYGRFGLQLRPGFYDVCVLAQAFTPQCRKVLVKSSQAANLKVRLKADPQVTKQLGDKF